MTINRDHRFLKTNSSPLFFHLPLNEYNGSIFFCSYTVKVIVIKQQQQQQEEHILAPETKYTHNIQIYV